MRISDWSSDVCSSDLELRTALALNPSFTLGHMAYGWALLRAGQCDEAIVETGRALRMSPVDNFSGFRSEEHTSELQSLMRISYAVFCLKKTTRHTNQTMEAHKAIPYPVAIPLLQVSQPRQR